MPDREHHPPRHLRPPARIALAALAAVCVLVTSARADTPCNAKYSKMSNVLMEDNETQILWRSNTNSNGAVKDYWGNASTACKNIGWDLPDVMQMQTLVDEKANVLRIDLPSPAPTMGGFWTKTAAPGGGHYYIAQNGNVASDGSTIKHQFYCVKTTTQ